MGDERPVLVAGKTGQVARCLVDVARKRRQPLVALGRPELDVTSREAIGRAIHAVAPRLVINAAAYTAVDDAEADRETAFAINRDGAGRLATAAAAAGLPYIHLSSDYVFDGRKPLPYVEQDPTCPLGIYGRSKLAGEEAVRDAYPAALVLRTSWIYSPYGRNFAKTMLRLAETRDVVSVVDDQHGAPTAAHDLAAALLDLNRAAKNHGFNGRAGVYHLTARGTTTWHGFAAAIFAGWRARGRRVPILERITSQEHAAKAARPANSRLDCTKVEQAFGIRLPEWQASLDPCLDALSGGKLEGEPC